MTEGFKPGSAAEAAEAVAWAAAEAVPLEVVSGASKRGLGRPVQAARTLDLSGLTGITLYEPEELVLSARAGTPLAEIEDLLADRRQQLAFEPPDLGPFYGGAAGVGTIAGAVACNLSGPRRIQSGAARDHLLGFQAVSGRGEAFKSGGRVVKNVTGYDLSKLLAGSYGTLAVMTEVTLKVLPAAEKLRTVLLFGLEPAAACGAMTRALGAGHDVSGAAHLPAAAAAGSAVSYVAGAGAAVTALRLEGPAPSVEHRCAELRRELADLGDGEELHGSNSSAFWRELRDLRGLAARSELTVWRLSIPPAAAPALLGALEPLEGAQTLLDWGGALVWLGVPAEPDEDAGAVIVRRAVAEAGGHATLLRAAEPLRARVPVFQPQEEARFALTRRIKESFDPRGVLNPGRIYAGV